MELLLLYERCLYDDDGDVLLLLLLCIGCRDCVLCVLLLRMDVCSVSVTIAVRTGIGDCMPVRVCCCCVCEDGVGVMPGDVCGDADDDDKEEGLYGVGWTEDDESSGICTCVGFLVCMDGIVGTVVVCVGSIAIATGRACARDARNLSGTRDVGVRNNDIPCAGLLDVDV